MLAVLQEWRLLFFAALVAVACLSPAAATAQTEDLPAIMGRITELTREGRFKDAIPLGQRLVAGVEKAVGNEHPMAAYALFTLAELHRMQGELSEAEPMLQRVLALREKLLGPDHADVASTLQSLAFLAISQANYRQAEQYAERALTIRTRVLGPEHSDTAMALVTLGRIYHNESRLTDAEQQFQRALALFEKAHGGEHINVAVTLNNLAQVYKEQGRLALAEPPLRRALAIQEKQFGPDSIFIAAMLNNLGELHRAVGRNAEAEALFRRELQISEKALGPDHPEVAISLGNLATLFTSIGRSAEAEGLLRRVLAINEKAFGPDHPSVAVALNNLANALSGLNRLGEAEGLFRRSLAIRERQFGADSVSAALALDNLAALLHQARRYAEAEPLARRSLDIREKRLGPDHLDTSNSLNGLAALLDNLKRHAEAGPMLERAVAIRRAALGDSHPLLAVSLHNLASHYLDVEDWQTAHAAFKRATAIWIARRGSAGAGGQDERAEIREHTDPFLGLVIAAHELGKTADAEARDKLRDEAFATAQWVTELGAAAAISGMSARVAAGGGRLGQLVRTRQDLAEEAAAVDRALIAAVSRPAEARKSDAELVLRQQAAAISLKLNEVDGALGGGFPEYASLTTAAPLPLADVAGLLSPSEALLLMLPTRDATFVWVVTRAQTRWVRVPIHSEDLARQIAALRCGLDFQGEWSGEAAGRCIDLLQPAALPGRGRRPPLRSDARPRPLRRPVRAGAGPDRRQASPDRALGSAHQPAVPCSGRRAAAGRRPVRCRRLRESRLARQARRHHRAAVRRQPQIAAPARQAEPGDGRVPRLRQSPAYRPRRQRPHGVGQASLPAHVCTARDSEPPRRFTEEACPRRPCRQREYPPPTAASRNRRRAMRGGAPARCSRRCGPPRSRGERAHREGVVCRRHACARPHRAFRHARLDGRRDRGLGRECARNLRSCSPRPTTRATRTMACSPPRR